MTMLPYNYGTYTAEAGVKYLLEVWGAQGGGTNSTGYYDGINHSGNTIGAEGGYSTGVFTRSTDTQMYICIGGGGGSGIPASSPGGHNGGGNGSGSTTPGYNGGGGGGGTDIRIGSYSSLYARVIVAGGGGGAEQLLAGNVPIAATGGGGEVAASSIYFTGGSQSSGYSFGSGGAGGRSNGAGGGGGWYGGTGSASEGGAGGSGYINTATSYKVSGYTLNSAEYYLTDASTRNGIDTQLGGTGANGINGKAVITQLKERRPFITPRRTTSATPLVLCLFIIQMFIVRGEFFCRGGILPPVFLFGRLPHFVRNDD